MSGSAGTKTPSAAKAAWVTPEVVPLSSRGPTRKLNREPAERSRSGISYAPS